MKDINVTVLAGRLTRDMELRYTKGGTAVGGFSLAVNRSVKRGDKWEDEASFFDCTMFGKRAEALAKYLNKGQQVVVSGELEQQRWEQNGQNRSKVVVIVSDLQLVGGKGEVKPERTGRHDDPQSPEDFQDDVPF